MTVLFMRVALSLHLFFSRRSFLFYVKFSSSLGSCTCLLSKKETNSIKYVVQCTLVVMSKCNLLIKWNVSKLH